MSTQFTGADRRREQSEVQNRVKSPENQKHKSVTVPVGVEAGRQTDPKAETGHTQAGQNKEISGWRIDYK